MFLPGEHSLDTTIVFELLESVLLVGNTTSLPNITSKIVCSRQLAALSFINVSKVEIKALAFASCGNGSIESPYAVVVVNLDNVTLLEQPDIIIHAVSALFVPNFRITSSSMEHCFLPLLLNRSRVYFQYDTFQYNMGHFGGAVTAYDNTLLFLGRNIFQYNTQWLVEGLLQKALVWLSADLLLSLVMLHNLEEVESVLLRAPSAIMKACNESFYSAMIPMSTGT